MQSISAHNAIKRVRNVSVHKKAMMRTVDYMIQLSDCMSDVLDC
jgi:hypothetical protein